MNITPDIIVPALETISQRIIIYLPRLAASLIVLTLGFKSESFFSNWIRKFFESHDYDESLKKFLYSLFGITFKIFIVLTAISIAGIQTTSIVAALGAAGFAVGLALQGSMSNFASGILILALKPFKVGEYIEVSNFSGTVNKIEIFNTILLTLDNKAIIVPNSELTSKVVINYSRQKNRRVDLSIGVGYDSNLEKTKRVLEASILKQGSIVLNDEKFAPIVRVDELGESAIVISVLVWCLASDYRSLKSNLLENIKTDLDKAKINIPYPTVTIHKN